MRWRGLLRAARHPLVYLVAVEGRRFDSRLGIETEGAAEPTELTIAHGDPESGFSYVPTPLRLGLLWLAALPPSRERFTFIDMGSGKGRVLALAASSGFGRVVGVEFARELHELASSNAIAASEHGVNFEPVLVDAATYRFPSGPLVVHFNNPFDESVMTNVLHNLKESYQHEPRPIVVVYQQAVHEGRKHSTRNLELLAETPFLVGRTVEPHGWIDRRILAPYLVRVFESPEIRQTTRGVA
jgi:SAM-dependent methyltransferase